MLESDNGIPSLHIEIRNACSSASSFVCIMSCLRQELIRLFLTRLFRSYTAALQADPETQHVKDLCGQARENLVCVLQRLYYMDLPDRIREAAGDLWTIVEYETSETDNLREALSQVKWNNYAPLHKLCQALGQPLLALAYKEPTCHSSDKALEVPMTCICDIAVCPRGHVSGVFRSHVERRAGSS